MHAFTDPAEVERVVRLFDAERRDDLLLTLRICANPEGHPAIQLGMAIGALLAYIGDPEVSAAFDAVEQRNA